MNDPIYETFVRRQDEAVAALSRESDIATVAPVDAALPRRYRISLECPTLVREASGGVRIHRGVVAGLVLPLDYLRRGGNPFAVFWEAPVAVFHPNVLPPFACLGRVTPGTPVCDLVHRLYEIAVFALCSPADPLNHDAARYARRAAARFPLDERPLRWRAPPGGGPEAA